MKDTVWERFTHDPRRSENAPLRASDHDRDVVNDLLAAAYADGRLTPVELDERSDQVAQARTLGDLPPVVVDLVPTLAVPKQLVGERRAEAERRYRQQRQQALFSFLTPTLVCWIVWVSLLVGGGTVFPWPLFVMIGTGMRYAQLATNREDSILAIEHELEKKERRRLQAEQRRVTGELPDHDRPGG